MNERDKIVWEAWGAVQQFASTSEAPDRLREIVAEYKRRDREALAVEAALRDLVAGRSPLLREPIAPDSTLERDEHGHPVARRPNKPAGIA